MVKALIAIVLATIFVIFTLTKIDPKNATNDSNITLVEEEYNSVTVNGEVNKPGTYVLSDGATFETLLMEAGGPTENADARCYFEGTPIKAGESYYIAPVKDVNDICGATDYVKVNINSDLKETLMTINGIGDTVASRIITYRETQGQFTYLEQIMEIDGIKQATFEKIKNHITLRWGD